MREDKRAEGLRGSGGVDTGLGTGQCAVHGVVLSLLKGNRRRLRVKRPEGP